jgi:hypothetical protein
MAGFNEVSAQVLLFNQTEYAKFKKGDDFVCINEPQCRYGDTSTKSGTFSIIRSEPDLFAVIKDSNMVQRAFLRVDLHIQRA